MTGRRRSAALCLAILALPLAVGSLHLEWNSSESGPLGLWRAYPGRTPAVGEFVQFCMRPEEARATHGRSYAGGARGGPCPFDTWMLVKPVVAGPGDTVIHTPGQVQVNGETLPLSATRTRDSEGHTVPVAPFTRVILGPGEFWVHSPYADGSFDSRYVGVVRRGQVFGTVRPLVTWLTSKQKSAVGERARARGEAASVARVQRSLPRCGTSTRARSLRVV